MSAPGPTPRRASPRTRTTEGGSTRPTRTEGSPGRARQGTRAPPPPHSDRGPGHRRTRSAVGPAQRRLSIGLRGRRLRSRNRRRPVGASGRRLVKSRAATGQGQVRPPPWPPIRRLHGDVTSASLGGLAAGLAVGRVADFTTASLIGLFAALGCPLSASYKAYSET